MPRRSLIAAVLVAGTLSVACADDGPDAASRGSAGPASAAAASPATSVAPVSTGPTDTNGPTDTDGPTGIDLSADDASADLGAPVPVEPNGISVRVQSLDNTFRPEVLEITAGTEVVWTNDGRIDHDVIASDGADWGVEADLFAPGDEYRHVFTLPGEYPYYCSIHGTAEFGMIGVVIVTD